MSVENTPTKGGKAAFWDNPAVLRELNIAFYQALTVGRPPEPKIKEAVAAYMAQEGHAISWDAIRQHIQKLRKNRQMAIFNDATAGNDGGATPPSKGKKASTTRKKATPKGKAVKGDDIKVDYSDFDDDDDEDQKDFDFKVKKEEGAGGDFASPKRPAKRARRDSVPAAGMLDRDDEI